MSKSDDDAVVRMLDSALVRASDVLKKFRADLKGDAAHAFEWSADAFEAAGITRVIGIVFAWRGEGRDFAWIRDHAQLEVNGRSKRGRRSTSEAANLMEAELMSAWAHVLEMLPLNGGES